METTETITKKGGQKITTSFKTSPEVRQQIIDRAEAQGLTLSQVCEDILTASTTGQPTTAQENTETPKEMELSTDALEMIRLKTLEALEAYQLQNEAQERKAPVVDTAEIAQKAIEDYTADKVVFTASSELKSKIDAINSKRAESGLEPLENSLSQIIDHLEESNFAKSKETSPFWWANI